MKLTKRHNDTSHWHHQTKSWQRNYWNGGMMNKSLVVVCDTLHITNLESIMHETVCRISVKQWINMKNSTFEKFQDTLNKSEKQRLKILLSECAEAIS